MSDLREDLLIKELPLSEEIVLTLNIGDEGVRTESTGLIVGFLDSVVIKIPEDQSSQYEVKLWNPLTEEIIVEHAEITKKTIWRPRVQPNFLPTQSRNMQYATFGVERAYFNEQLGIQVKGTQNTTVNLIIRVLKRE